MSSVQKSPPALSAPGVIRTGRLLSLDAFRGLTILAMIVVNNPGKWGDQYWPLSHAEWHGWTPTDLIFPFFLFIVGTALAYSFRKFQEGGRIAPRVYWRIARRTAVLIFLGMLPGILVRLSEYFGGDSETLDFSTLRFTGVLQRIAIVYLITSLVVLFVPLRAQIVLAIVVLLGYWAVMGLLPHAGEYERNLSPDGNVSGLIDRAVFTPPHMYTYNAETDQLREMTEPEGILSTFPAIVTCLLGYWSGMAIQRRELNYETLVLLLGCGAVCVEVGLLWNLAFPINKKIWTSSFVLLTGGLAMQLLSGCLLKFDLWGWRRLARPFEIVGINAIFVYVASGLTATLLGRLPVAEGVSAHEWLYQNLFTSWIADPKLASLSYAVAFAACWWLVCWIMARLGWTIRV